MLSTEPTIWIRNWEGFSDLLRLRYGAGRGQDLNWQWEIRGTPEISLPVTPGTYGWAPSERAAVATASECRDQWLLILRGEPSWQPARKHPNGTHDRA